jgi:hypothetical protein
MLRIFWILILLLPARFFCSTDYVTIAILAKDKAHTLPIYLTCIEQQTWPKSKTYLYIRTNNNNDHTVAILTAWIEKVGTQYAGIYFDASDVPEQVQKYGQHEWNSERFKVLGQIRQDSISWALEKKSHYFVIDCDNFIKPHTLETLLNANLPIVAPLLHTGTTLYSNYHAAIDAHGYYANSPFYLPLLNRDIKGLVQVPVVHCTYFIKHEILAAMLYNDGTSRYEYVIFSDNARKKSIPQYLDTRELYGYISFAENSTQLAQEPWLAEFMRCLDVPE